MNLIQREKLEFVGEEKKSKTHHTVVCAYSEGSQRCRALSKQHKTDGARRKKWQREWAPKRENSTTYNRKKRAARRLQCWALRRWPNNAVARCFQSQRAERAASRPSSRPVVINLGSKKLFSIQIKIFTRSSTWRVLVAGSDRHPSSSLLPS